MKFCTVVPTLKKTASKATHAWNSLISGRKRWVLIPKHVPREKVELKFEEAFVGCMYRGDAAIMWFQKVLPRLKKQKEFPVIDIIQEPGETLFVPSGNFSQKSKFGLKSKCWPPI